MVIFTIGSDNYISFAATLVQSVRTLHPDCVRVIVLADTDAKALIDWGADRCQSHCRADIPAHMFTDQRWMDMAPVLSLSASS